MSDNNKFEQLIELFIAEDEQGAKDLFHEIVVEKSRDIYESLVDEEQVEETAEVEEDAEAVEESEDETVEESEFDEAEIGGDQSDDMIDDIEADEQGLSMEADMDDEEIEDRVVDIENALEELKAEFDALMGGDDAEGGDEEMDMDMDMDAGDEEGDEEEGDEEEMESVEEETEEMVREYTEKAPAPVTAEQGDGSAGPVAGKNDMGGSAKNLAQGGEEKGGATPKSTVQTDAANPKGATMSKA
jgi:hypothetical protein